MKTMQTKLLVGIFGLSALTCLADIGDRCEPGEVDSRPGITCQATEEWEYSPSHIQNARKGDIILSSRNSMIGQLLEKVGNRYSHCGIIVQDSPMKIYNSTASEDRLKDHAGVDGFPPDMLKYLWPGTQPPLTVDQAYEGQFWPAPEGRSYFHSPFSSRPNDNDGLPETPSIFPSVVKPGPFWETTPGIRDSLKAIADASLTIRGHYRIYCYSQADILDDPARQAPPESGWANLSAPQPTVCSQLIWGAARRAGVQVEDGMRDEDEREQPAGETQRGLYLYTAAERRTAADWLYQHIYDQVYDDPRVGDWGRLLEDVPDDTANQVCNCFASDWSDGDAEDSDAWKFTGDGLAISPDDLMSWDAPDRGGVYGLRQDMEYRPGRYTRIHRWARSEGTADVIVFTDYRGLGRLAEGATIELRGYGSARADGDGKVRFESVPGGTYELLGSLTLADGTVVTDEMRVAVPSSGETTQFLTLSARPLEPPFARSTRKITGSGRIWIQDGPGTGTSQWFDLTLPTEPIILDPAAMRQRTIPFRQCFGGEILMVLTLTLRLEENINADGITQWNVRAILDSTMFEDDDCPNTDLEDSDHHEWLLLEDAPASPIERRVISPELGGGDDQSRIIITLANERDLPPP